MKVTAHEVAAMYHQMDNNTEVPRFGTELRWIPGTAEVVTRAQQTFYLHEATKSRQRIDDDKLVRDLNKLRAHTCWQPAKERRSLAIRT